MAKNTHKTISFLIFVLCSIILHVFVKYEYISLFGETGGGLGWKGQKRKLKCISKVVCIYSIHGLIHNKHLHNINFYYLSHACIYIYKACGATPIDPRDSC